MLRPNYTHSQYKRVEGIEGITLKASQKVKRVGSSSESALIVFAHLVQNTIDITRRNEVKGY